MNRFKSLISAVVFCITPGGFGMPEQVANDNPGEIVERVRNILDNTRNIRRIPERRDVNTKLVVLLGATGSGKTSLLHVLAGSGMNVQMLAFAGRRFMVPNAEAADRIGIVAGGGNAVTSDVHPFPIENVVYCDGPGLFDTNGGFAEMGNNLIMNEILKEGSKILWVVSTDEILAMRGGAANRSLDYLLSLLPERRTSEAEKKARSVGVVISKGPWNGSAEEALRWLQEQEGHHWLIDYLQAHTGTNAFWFPAPREEGVYEPPQDLVEKITNFANTCSSLIYGSMGLQPEVIDRIIEKRAHFDVKDKVDEIVNHVGNGFEIHKENLDELLKLEGAFSTLWSSLAAEMTNQPGQQDELQRRWRRRGSDPIKKFNFTLRNFVDVLNEIEYFRNLCNVQVYSTGFNSWFENGLLWEELVDCISNLSSTSENAVARLRDIGDGWKDSLSGLSKKNREITKAVKENLKTQRERRIVRTASATGALAGAVTGGFFGGSIIASAGGAGGAVVGATAGAVFVKGVNSVQDFLSNYRRGANQRE